MARGVEDHAAVDDAQFAVHAQPQAFEHRGEVPGVDRLAVDGGLAAHRVEAGAVEEGRQQRMAAQRLVEPGEGGGGAFERAGDTRRGDQAGGSAVSQNLIEHQRLLPRRRPADGPVAHHSVRG